MQLDCELKYFLKLYVSCYTLIVNAIAEIFLLVLLGFIWKFTY